MRPRPFFRKYTCAFDSLILSIRDTARAEVFEVRVVQKPQDQLFSQALIIRPGTQLKLCFGRNSARFITVRVFIPRMQYGGRFVAGGMIEI
jgi:hypothetical protein